MSTLARQAFPDALEGKYYSFYDYDRIVRLFGDIVVSGCAGDYQGDYFYLTKGDDNYTFWEIGYGSCSGCDALQACKDYDEVDDLIEGLWQSAHKERAAEGMLDWIRNGRDDEELQWSYSAEEYKEFRARCIEFLEKEIG